LNLTSDDEATPGNLGRAPSGRQQGSGTEASRRAWLRGGGDSSTMARAYSNGYQSSSSAYHDKPLPRFSDDSSLIDDFLGLVKRTLRSLWRLAKGRGRQLALAYAMEALRQLKRNLTVRRIWSFPHLLVVLWVFVLLWGERWVFHTKVEKCHWSNWESWVSFGLGYAARQLNIACLLTTS